MDNFIKNRINIAFWGTMQKRYLNLDPNNSIKIKVLSSSMTPTIESGEFVNIKGTKFNSIEIGSIILFAHCKNHMTIHRVVAIESIDESICYKTKGDANNLPDKYIVTDSEVIGTVV